jgi:hypothetical protein
MGLMHQKSLNATIGLGTTRHSPSKRNGMQNEGQQAWTDRMQHQAIEHSSREAAQCEEGRQKGLFGLQARKNTFDMICILKY